MGKVQVVAKWKVHVTPPNVLGWDGDIGVHPRGQ
jgi:hypothetical protein